MAFERKLADIKDFIKAINGREPYDLLSDAREDLDSLNVLDSF